VALWSGGGVNVLLDAVVVNEPIVDVEHVATRRGELAPVQALVAHVHRGNDDAIFDLSHLEGLPSESGDRAEERLRGRGKVRLRVGRIGIAEAECTSSAMTEPTVAKSLFSTALNMACTMALGLRWVVVIVESCVKKGTCPERERDRAAASNTTICASVSPARRWAPGLATAASTPSMAPSPSGVVNNTACPASDASRMREPFGRKSP
jgi:hypothetical protein